MTAAVRDDFLTMPGHLLRRCHQIGVAVFLDQCRDHDLTPLQFGVLAALERFGAMDQASLGGVTALDRTTILVDVRLVQERLLAPLSARERMQLVALLTKIALQNNALSRAPHRLP